MWSKKQDKANLFTAAEEVIIQFEDSQDTTSKRVCFSKVLDWLKPQQEEQDNKIKTNSKKYLTHLKRLPKRLVKVKPSCKQVETEFSELKTKHSEIGKHFTDLKAKLERRRKPRYTTCT